MMLRYCSVCARGRFGVINEHYSMFFVEEEGSKQF